MNDTPTLAEFEDAAQTLRGIITRTPLDESLHLTELLGVPVHLKLENLQRTGSFKIRGATYRLSRLTARSALAASSRHRRATTRRASPSRRSSSASRPRSSCRSACRCPSSSRPAGTAPR